MEIARLCGIDKRPKLLGHALAEAQMAPALFLVLVRHTALSSGRQLLLKASLSDQVDAAQFRFALRREGKEWFAKRLSKDQNEFYVGREIAKKSNSYFGIYQPTKKYYGPVFDVTRYVPVIDQWAYLLDVTSYCESKGRLNLVNTYDRAQFTFGFYQMAAHTPRDNLILLFRAGLNESEFRRVFPELKLNGHQVFHVAEDGSETNLEEETYYPAHKEYQLRRFMNYLNSQRLEIDDQELMQAARMIWWANNSSHCEKLQITVANASLQRKMSDFYARWYKLDGQLDVVCAIIADIHHQGRGKIKDVKKALKARDKVKALLKIGRKKYPTRTRSLKRRLDKWVKAKRMGIKKYSAAMNDFEGSQPD